MGFASFFCHNGPKRDIFWKRNWRSQVVWPAGWVDGVGASEKLVHQYKRESQNITDSISTTEKKSKWKSGTNTKEDNVNNEKLLQKCRGTSMNVRDHLVGWPTNQDNKRANSAHLTPCNSHLDELTNIYKCKTGASDAVTWYTQVRKEGTLSLIWHPINIVQIEYPRWEVHQLLSGYHWRSAHERLIFNPNLHLSPMAFPRGIFDLDVKSHRISFNFYRW